MLENFVVALETTGSVFTISEGLFEPIIATITSVATQALPAVVTVAGIGIGISWVRRFMGQMRRG